MTRGVRDTTEPCPAAAGEIDGRGAWRRRVSALAVPIVLANLGVSLAGVADIAVMGRMSSPLYLSATAIGATLFSTLYWAFGFLRMGTGGLIAQAFGAREAETQRRVTIRALALAAAIGVLLVLLSEPLLALGLGLMAGGAELHALTGDYFRVRMLSAPATLALFAIQGTLIGRQSMRAVLGLQLLQNGLNVALNIALFALTDLAIVGVAAATVTSELVTLAVGLWLLRPVLRPVLAIDEHRAPLREWMFERAALARLLALSGDLFVRSLCLTLAYYWLTAAGTRLGPVVLAANAVLLQFVALTAQTLDGFAHAAEALSGEAIGRRDPAGLSRAIGAATSLAVGLAAALALLWLLAGPLAIDLMTTQETVREAARVWLPWAVAVPLVGVWSFLLDGIFIGATRTREMRQGMLVSLAAFVAATLALVPLLGNHGLWLSYHVLLVVRAYTLWRHRARVWSMAAG